ncbi:wsc domain-containing protein [Rutstroemia sp. NJR-2017a WRK4]|nr:wsc domain-containing protein [Rutstroemia sp. NJR-2017a WRK4]
MYHPFTLLAITALLGINVNASPHTLSFRRSLLPQIPGYEYSGCYTETPTSKALTGAAFVDDLMTVEDCADACMGFGYFGLENARECYCGNRINDGSVMTALSECAEQCPGDSSENCGASERLDVWRSETGATRLEERDEVCYVDGDGDGDEDEGSSTVVSSSPTSTVSASPESQSTGSTITSEEPSSTATESSSTTPVSAEPSSTSELGEPSSTSSSIASSEPSTTAPVESPTPSSTSEIGEPSTTTTIEPSTTPAEPSSTTEVVEPSSTTPAEPSSTSSAEPSTSSESSPPASTEIPSPTTSSSSSSDSPSSTAAPTTSSSTSTSTQESTSELPTSTSELPTSTPLPSSSPSSTQPEPSPSSSSAPPAPPAPTNTIANGDFESPAPGGWTIKNGALASLVYNFADTNNPHSGSFAGSVTYTQGYSSYQAWFNRPVTLNGGVRYNFSAWTRASAANPGCGVYYYIGEANRDVLLKLLVQVSSPSLRPTWIQSTGFYDVPATGQYTLNVRLTCSSSAGSRAYYFDDLQLVAAT